ncbi:MmcQ/YjbR family DNA-binding protein [Providencia rettgeri]|nr:MmcQ/YjbR family DNA-binding protein [Providencia rettgeri]
MKRSELIDYIQSNYGVVAESPWKNLPKYRVFRHENNSKWFAVLMNVTSKTLSENGGNDMVDIVNIKASPELVGSLRLKEHVYPAYHMNKEHWITIILGRGFPENELKALIDDSYKLTTKR